MPISEEKTVLMHCGQCQPFNVYTLNGIPIASTDSHTVLGVIPITDSSILQHGAIIAVTASSGPGIVN